MLRPNGLAAAAPMASSGGGGSYPGPGGITWGGSMQGSPVHRPASPRFMDPRASNASRRAASPVSLHTRPSLTPRGTTSPLRRPIGVAAQQDSAVGASMYRSSSLERDRAGALGVGFRAPTRRIENAVSGRPLVAASGGGGGGSGVYGPGAGSGVYGVGAGLPSYTPSGAGSGIYSAGHSVAGGTKEQRRDLADSPSHRGPLAASPSTRGAQYDELLDKLLRASTQDVGLAKDAGNLMDPAEVGISSGGNADHRFLSEDEVKRRAQGGRCLFWATLR
eukprot:gnl/TRDRNA2_/TRDRNA2_195978_c0_seq1.p1 gnl/TRDRNA2_/TRDRNA2_195978_c0~~gnl/TRDRNA2_/TRDRNA2_195978_c0_seq1.p1  ORF type:complete len:305 (+),score=39.31 gnl/TRDRNA2_/TRDRNA2_195978_c0_seq1:86-916(+)